MTICARLLVVLGTISGTMYGNVIYNAALGTLPQDQGWTYQGNQGNPSPSVSGGALHQIKNVLNTAVYWSFSDNLDIAGHIYLQASLQVNSSNEVPNVGTGTREGYYFVVLDANGTGYTIGLADNGFNINTVEVPNHPLTPYPVAGPAFHTYAIDINNGLGNFFIDGVLKAGSITPYIPLNVGLRNTVFFGASAGASISITNLANFCETTVGSCSAASTTPEPSTTILFGTAGVILLGTRRIFKRLSVSNP